MNIDFRIESAGVDWTELEASSTVLSEEQELP